MTGVVEEWHEGCKMMGEVDTGCVTQLEQEQRPVPFG